MNERIRELAKVAVQLTDDTVAHLERVHNRYFTSGEIDEIYDAKFAELIIRECMLCCERVISDPVPKSVDTWLNGGKQCIDEIKYHFGVEE